MRAFTSGRLTASELILLSEHLESCSECGDLYDQVFDAEIRLRHKSSDRWIDSYLVGQHLDYEQISGYLDRQLNQEQAKDVDAHCYSCAMCRKDLADLREFRNGHGIQSSHRKILEGITDALRKIRTGYRVPVYGSALALLLLGLLLLQLYRSKGQKSPQTLQPPHQIVGETEVPQTKHPQPNPTMNRPGGKPSPSPSVLPPKLAMYINDSGKTYGLGIDGRPQGLGFLPAEIRSDVAGVLQGRRIDDSVLQEVLGDEHLKTRSGEGEKERLSLISPVGTLIEEDHPIFRWKPLGNEITYVVNVVDESFNPVAQSPKLTIAEWTIDQPLVRGKAYIWQVKAFSGSETIESQPNQIGRFKILTEDKLRVVRRLRRLYRSHLVLGIALARAGLIDQAEIELRQFLLENQNSSEALKIFQTVLPGRDPKKSD